MKTVTFVEKTGKFSTKSRFSDAQIRQVARGGKTRIANWVSKEVSHREITLRRRPTDKFARAVSRLSDGVVDLDPVEEKLVAMRRAGVITAHQRGLLQVQYLR